MSSHLILDDKLCDLGWNTLIAIQSSAFLMTLKRKSLIRSRTHLFWYTLALFLSIFYIWQVKGWFFLAVVFFLFCLKVPPAPSYRFPQVLTKFVQVKFDVNKYVMWTTFTIGAYALDQVRTPIMSTIIKLWHLIATTTFCT